MDGISANDMLEDILEDRHEARYRRIEVITGTRRRRNWSPGEKATIVAESAEPGANISAVARRWGVHRGLLNVWRRQAGLSPVSSGRPRSSPPMFVPVSVAGGGTNQKPGPCSSDNGSSVRIEIEIAGAHLVMTGAIAPELAQAVVLALRGDR